MAPGFHFSFTTGAETAVPISWTINVFGAICPGFGPELMCTDSSKYIWQWYRLVAGL